MVILKIHNDAKEKRQSFEAWINGIDCEKGYGSTEKEAIKEYAKNLLNMQRRITVACQDLKLGNFEIIEVDCLGEKR